jgi:hypothetical protein
MILYVADSLPKFPFPVARMRDDDTGAVVDDDDDSVALS